MQEHYADLADEADRIFSAIKDKRIALIRKNAASIDTHNASGECWYCGAETGSSRRWCNRECVDAWERDQ